MGFMLWALDKAARCQISGPTHTWIVDTTRFTNHDPLPFGRDHHIDATTYQQPHNPRNRVIALGCGLLLIPTPTTPEIKHLRSISEVVAFR